MVWFKHSNEIELLFWRCHQVLWMEKRFLYYCCCCCFSMHRTLASVIYWNCIHCERLRCNSNIWNSTWLLFITVKLIDLFFFFFFSTHINWVKIFLSAFNFNCYCLFLRRKKHNKSLVEIECKIKQMNAH